MAHCPSCGNNVDKPSKELTNSAFTISGYDCTKCHTKFKVTK